MVEIPDFERQLLGKAAPSIAPGLCMRRPRSRPGRCDQGTDSSIGTNGSQRGLTQS
jgi:hypothetical protein